MPEIVQLLASPVHRFVGRPSDGPEPAPAGELVGEIQVRAELGIVGDRYFGRPAHRQASVTVIAAESLPPGVGLTQVRRNILTSGLGVDDLVGSVLVLDSGHGPVRLRMNRAAHPCAWMDVDDRPRRVAWPAWPGRRALHPTHRRHPAGRSRRRDNRGRSRAARLSTHPRTDA
ncbi:hypothetical protein GCM10029963_04320 [Micromonospora andamanensis]|nr:hypothetical protein Vwe01_32710 [Micromonospora andamanensis]